MKIGRPLERPIGRVLARVMEACGVSTLKELAIFLGATEGNVRNWHKRGRVPSDWIAIAEQRSKADLTDLLSPFSDQYAENEDENGMVVVGEAIDASAAGAWHFSLPSELDDREFELIPRYNVRASAGRGAGEQFDEEKAGDWAFEVNWMRRNFGRTGRGFAAVMVRGDSMAPTLLNGDEIIIDRQATRVDADGVYVIALRGDLLVKRVQLMLDGSLVVRSDNPAYPPQTVTAERANDFRVIGRMVWPRVR